MSYCRLTYKLKRKYPIIFHVFITNDRCAEGIVEDLGSFDEDPYSLDCADSDYDPSDCIVANSDDLAPHYSPGGEIKYETRTVGSDYVFIVEWEDVPAYGHASDPTNTFQIILFDSSDPDCDPIRIQWALVYEQIDTLVQYNAGNWDVEVCLYDDGGQHVPGAILVVKQ